MIRVLNFTMVGHFVLHDFVGGARVAVEAFLAEGFEFGLELFIGSDAGVLEFTQTLVGEEIEITIRNDLLECFLAGIIESMVGTREPDKIGSPVVGSDTVEVVALIAIALLVGGLFADPCECYRNMEVDVSMIAHLVVPLFAVAVKAVTRARVKDGCYRSVDPDELTGLMVFDENM